MTEKVFEGILICTDFDGTLAYRGEITEENLHAIRHFQEHGGLFTIVSGRSPRFIEAYQGKLELNTYVCGFNGTIVADPVTGQRIYDMPMDGAEVFAFVQKLVPSFPEVQIVEFQSDVGNVPFVRKDGLITLDASRIPKNVYKVLFVVPDEHSDTVLERMRVMAGAQYTVSRSWINGIEIQMAGEDKSVAVKALRRQLGELLRLVIGIGDYENDLPLLAAADVAIAAEDAIDEVRKATDTLTTSCRADSIAAVVRRLELCDPVIWKQN